jgi:hypothetical protein
MPQLKNTVNIDSIDLDVVSQKRLNDANLKLEIEQQKVLSILRTNEISIYNKVFGGNVDQYVNKDMTFKILTDKIYQLCMKIEKKINIIQPFETDEIDGLNKNLYERYMNEKEFIRDLLSIVSLLNPNNKDILTPDEFKIIISKTLGQHLINLRDENDTALTQETITAAGDTPLTQETISRINYEKPPNLREKYIKIIVYHKEKLDFKTKNFEEIIKLFNEIMQTVIALTF